MAILFVVSAVVCDQFCCLWSLVSFVGSGVVCGLVFVQLGFVQLGFWSQVQQTLDQHAVEEARLRASLQPGRDTEQRWLSTEHTVRGHSKRAQSEHRAQ